MKKKFHPGDRVIVPWGLDEIEGTVVDTFGPPGKPFVTVRIELPDDDADAESNDIGFRAEDLREAATAQN